MKRMKRFTYKAQGVKGCPFCGSNEIQMVTITLGVDTVANLECLNCGAIVSFYGAEMVKAATEHWNRRANDASHNN